MNAVKEYAYAKINLYLDVVALREDGFHDIKSIMHAVDLSDEITVKFSPSNAAKIRVFVSGNRYLPTDEKNLAYRAAALFMERAAVGGDVEIKIVKRIPVAAGLAGGSADAAAVFRAMNKIFGRMFSEKALIKMSSELGSDIPFCLIGKTVLCEGRGEVMTPINFSQKLNLVIAIADEHISTPRAYKRLDEIYSSFDGSVKTEGDSCFFSIISEIKRGRVGEGGLFNIFEEAVFPECPGAKWLKEKMKKLGARAALMSGSGPSVFGIFDSESQAVEAARVLRDEKITAHYAQSAF